MKKIFITGMLMLAALCAGAQVVNVGQLQRVEGVNSGLAVISPDGTFVVTRHDGGLVKTDIATGSSTRIATGENLYGIAISTDGTQVVYTRPTFNKKHLRYNSLESVDLGSGKTTVVVKPTRHLNAGVALSGNTVNAVANGKAQARSLDGAKAQKAPVASINYGHLDVTVDGKTVSIDPQGRGSYLWPSVSPDGKRVVYRLSGVGTFTCNLDGSDVRPVGNYMFPVWAGNDVVIGVRETEGQNQVLTAACLVAVDAATGEAQTLTADDMIVTAPSATADGTKVAFSDEKGSVYVLSLTK